MALNLDRQQKVTISLAGLVAVIVGFWQLHQWIAGHSDRYFFSEAQAGELTEQVRHASDAAKSAAEAAKSTSDTLTRYIAQQEVKNARERLNVLNGQLSETKLWEASNGENAISRSRKADLENQINSMKVYVDCLERRGTDCVL